MALAILNPTCPLLQDCVIMVDMKANLSFKISAALTLVFQCLLNSACLADTVPIHFQVPSFIQLESESASLTLLFPDFSPGSDSETSVMNYTIKTNNVTRQRGVLMARLDSSDPEIALQALFRDFHSKGGNAALIPHQKGFVTLSKQDAFLADKETVAGSGKIIHGQFEIAYKALAIRELTAGTRVRTIKLTFTDV